MIIIIGIRRIPETDEWRVSYNREVAPGQTRDEEASAYYTDDPEDAAGTALEMVNEARWKGHISKLSDSSTMRQHMERYGPPWWRDFTTFSSDHVPVEPREPTPAELRRAETGEPDI